MEKSLKLALLSCDNPRGLGQRSWCETRAISCHLGSSQDQVQGWSPSTSLWAPAGGPGQAGAEATCSPSGSALLVVDQQDVCQAGLVTHPSLPQSCPCQGQELPTSRRVLMGKEQRFGCNPEVAGCKPRQTELAWRHVCVDITKGSTLPFNLSQPMELTSVWQTWDCSCCLVIQLKIFYFPPESLQDVCEYMHVSVRD